jgi:hypothetical protein
MNTVKVSLSQQTLDSTVNRIIQSFNQTEPKSTELINESGVKITGNVLVDKPKLESITLVEPNIISLNNVEVSFSTLNIVIGIDVERIKGEFKIAGVEVASWDFFEENPDINLTLGLEEFIKPNFTGSMKCYLNNLDVIIGLNDFKVHDLNIPNDIASRIQQNVISEMTNFIKNAIPGRWDDEIIRIINLDNIARYLPFDNIGDWILSKLLEGRKIEAMIEETVKSKISDEVVYTALSDFKLGTGDKQVTLVLEDVNPITIEVKEQQLSVTINFKDL